MAYVYLDGELIDLPDVQQLGTVQSGGLVPLLKQNGDLVGLASLAGGGFITIGEPPVILQLEEDESEEDGAFEGV
jgi:hypothetical protein